MGGHGGETVLVYYLTRAVSLFEISHKHLRALCYTKQFIPEISFISPYSKNRKLRQQALNYNIYIYILSCVQDFCCPHEALHFIQFIYIFQSNLELEIAISDSEIMGKK